MHQVAKLQSSQTVFFENGFTGISVTSILHDPNPIEHLWEEAERESGIMDWQPTDLQ